MFLIESETYYEYGLYLFPSYSHHKVTPPPLNYRKCINNSYRLKNVFRACMRIFTFCLKKSRLFQRERGRPLPLDRKHCSLYKVDFFRELLDKSSALEAKTAGQHALCKQQFVSLRKNKFHNVERNFFKSDQARKNYYSVNSFQRKILKCSN